jgi:hypothetical protein
MPKSKPAATNTSVIERQARAIRSSQVLGKYASAFREMINVRVRSKPSIRKLLKLNDDSDWGFLTAAMDIIDDASAAISNVEHFGLDGPTKYDEIGEKYLRLYGLLSAIYNQQRAVIRMCKIMKVSNPSRIKDAFDDLTITHLRHKLAAHSVGYANQRTRGIEAYAPVRIGFGEFQITLMSYTALSTPYEKANVLQVLHQHTELMISTMDQLVERTIKHLFGGEAGRHKRFTQELRDLRLERCGGLVVKAPGALKIIIAPADPNSTSLRRTD